MGLEYIHPKSSFAIPPYLRRKNRSKQIKQPATAYLGLGILQYLSNAHDRHPHYGRRRQTRPFPEGIETRCSRTSRATDAQNAYRSLRHGPRNRYHSFPDPELRIRSNPQSPSHGLSSRDSNGDRRYPTWQTLGPRSRTLTTYRRMLRL